MVHDISIAGSHPCEANVGEVGARDARKYGWLEEGSGRPWDYPRKKGVEHFQNSLFLLFA